MSVASPIAQYEPRGAARDLFYCQNEEILLEGPAGTGKTRAALEKSHLCAMKYPGARILLLRQTRESMTESVLVTFEERVMSEGAADPVNREGSRDGRRAYLYRNGSSIVIGGFKQYGRDQSAKVMSTDYDKIVIFEGTEVNQNDYEKAMTRLRHGVIPYQQVVVDCNPSNQSHWLNQRASAGIMTRLRSRHEDNPMLFDRGEWTEMGKSYLAKLDRLTGHRKERLRHGRWANAEGVVYEDFEPKINVIPSFVIPSDWRRIRAIDFGFQNPFVCHWWAMDSDGRMYLYREIYRSRRLVEDHAKEINRLSIGERYEATIADHDAEDRATLDRHGIPTIPANKSISLGIAAMQARLRKAEDSRPRMYVLEGALIERDPMLDDAKKPASTVEEFDGYVWPKGQDGKPMKEVPVKENDHGMDAARYAAMYLDVSGVIFEPRVMGGGNDEKSNDGWTTTDWN